MALSPPTTPLASYDYARSAEAQFRGEVRKPLESGAKRFCDIGGGAQPVIAPARIEELELEYVVLDESHVELDKGAAGYEQLRASILDADAIGELVRERGPFEVAVSRWTAEHVPDGRRFHENVYRMLRPGGLAIHVFPTLYALPFVLNRVLPPALSALVLSGAQPEREAEKFRPYYSWCRGPSRRQIQRLESVGFRVERYTGFFGHGYFARIKPLHAANRQLTERLVARPLPSMTSFALVVLRRPA
jgi:2-polyprenyl-3-methyl-5-hydroxy-6-metoxy-1,4-benzoquinol methylase